MSINIYQVSSGLRILSDNSDISYNEWSFKRNNLNDNKLTIISDIDEDFSEYNIDFNKESVYFNSELVPNAESLNNLLLETTNNGFIDKNNSSTTPLGVNETFTGQATNILNYSSIGIMIESDADGILGGLTVQFSFDGNIWHDGESYTIKANATKFFTPPKQGVYYRVTYKNDGTAQTYFHLHSLISKMPIKWSSHNINSTLNDDDDSELVSAVIKLRTAKDDYVSGAATNSGNFKVSLEEIESGISTNNNSQLNSSPYIVDEYGNYNHQLGDNGFKGAILSIPVEHHEIHCGDSYTAHHVADLGNGASIDYLIITPDWGDPVDGDDPMGNQTVKVAHFIGEISGESETTVYFYEAPTITNNGTALSVNNRNRNSANVDYLSIYQGATISAVGTELEHNVFGSGKLVGGGLNRTDEWILKNNTAYLMRVINNTTSSNYHTIRFQYYIHPGI